MKIDFNLAFQDRLGTAIYSGQSKKLGDIFEECYTKISSTCDNAERDFYLESLKLIEMTNFWKGFDDSDKNISNINKQLIRLVEEKVAYLEKNRTKDRQGVQKMHFNLNKALNSAKRAFEATFQEMAVPGDGDCGFHAIGISRKETVRYLKSQCDSAEVRKIVGPEIRGWLLTNGFLYKTQEENKKKFPDKILQITAEFQEKYSKVDVNDRVEKDKCEAEFLDKLSIEKQVFMSYIENYYIKKRGYLVIPDRTSDTSSTGVLNVIANWKKITINVWKQHEGKDGELYLHYIANPDIEKSERKRICDIFHSSLHFNRLIFNPKIRDKDPSLNELCTYKSAYNSFWKWTI